MRDRFASKAARCVLSSVVSAASKSLRDLRVAEVQALDVTIEKGKVSAYRAKLKVSFKFEGN